MTRKQIGLWAFAVALIAAAFVGAYLGLGPSPIGDVSEAQGQQNQIEIVGSENDGGVSAWRAVLAPQVIFPLLTVISTLLLASIAASQVKHHRDATRAHIFVEITDDRWLGNVQGAGPHIGFKYVNHGDTPAILTGRCDDLILSDALPARATYSDPRPSEVVVGGRQASFGLTRNLSDESGKRRVLTSEEAKGFEAGHLKFFLYGYVTYEDVFGVSRTTGFGYQVRRESRANISGIAGGRPYNYRKKGGPKR